MPQIVQAQPGKLRLVAHRLPGRRAAGGPSRARTHTHRRRLRRRDARRRAGPRMARAAAFNGTRCSFFCLVCAEGLIHTPAAGRSPASAPTASRRACAPVSIRNAMHAAARSSWRRLSACSEPLHLRPGQIALAPLLGVALEALARVVAAPAPSDGEAHRLRQQRHGAIGSDRREHADRRGAAARRRRGRPRRPSGRRSPGRCAGRSGTGPSGSSSAACAAGRGLSCSGRAARRRSAPPGAPSRPSSPAASRRPGRCRPPPRRAAAWPCVLACSAVQGCPWRPIETLTCRPLGVRPWTK